MSIWTSGYVTDIGYTYGFYSEQSPASLTCALRLSGYDFRLRDDFTYCELGIGQGVTAALLAAAHPEARFFGNDFNASHVLHARDLAAAGGVTNLTVSPASFQDYGDDPDLPESFDIISLHGIYSWVDEGLRTAIREFVRKKLAVGGVLYVSYNALPGWSTILPLRQLIYDHGMRGSGDAGARVQAAMDFVEKLKDLSPGFFRNNPAMASKLENLKAMPPAYVAHEYFNQIQAPFYFSAVAEEMSELGLTFAGSGNFLDRFARRTMSPEQRAFLDALPTETERESMFDYFANQTFRRDLFVRGGRKMSPARANAVRTEQRYVAVKTLAEIPEKLPTVTGAAGIKRESVDPVVGALLERPSTLGELVQALNSRQLAPAGIEQSLEYLMAAGCVTPALPAAGEKNRKRSTQVFNRNMLSSSADSENVLYVASPVTGQGFPLGRFDMQMLQVYVERRGKEDECVNAMWNNLLGLGQRLVKDGKPLATDEDNMTELRARLKEFVAKRVPVLRTLGIIE